MKAMIFAAGLGTRLKPLTDSTPKALLPINGKPMLEHVILKLKDAGFHQIAINVHHLGDQIINFWQPTIISVSRSISPTSGIICSIPVGESNTPPPFYKAMSRF